MKFSYSAVWEEAGRLLKASAPLLIALAGVFLFLPALLMAHFIPQPPSAPDRFLADLAEYFTKNWHWILLANLINMIGAISILILVFGRGSVTVGGAIGLAGSYLPSYFVASVLSGLVVGMGLVAFIIPGVYLFGRLAPLGAVIVAEDRRNPLQALKRCFELTKGRGWAIVGLVLIVFLAGMLLSMVITWVLGGIFLLVGGETVGRLLLVIVQSGASAAVSTVMIVLFAAIYGRISADASGAPAAH